MNHQTSDYTPFSLAQRACAACWAIVFLRSAVSFLALALPPFSPPRRPRATAAGFFVSDPPIASSTARSAFWKSSLFALDRLGMDTSWHRLDANYHGHFPQTLSLPIDLIPMFGTCYRSRRMRPRGARPHPMPESGRKAVFPSEPKFSQKAAASVIIEQL